MKARLLVIAGHDPSGGAGIHADIEAIHALGGFASTLITALTVQNSQSVSGFQMTPIELLRQQADCLLDDMQFDAVKIGMTGNAEVIALIESLLPRLGDIPVVLDPVLAAESGGSLAEGNLLAASKRLLPQVSLITPNLPEAQQLSGETEVTAVGESLLAAGSQAVLVTGTHDATDEVHNHLFQPSGHSRQSWPRLDGSFHGSGCTLASAIACLLAQGEPLEAAVARAQDYVYSSLQQAFRPGRGQWIPHR